jgi:hypothetical protein
MNSRPLPGSGNPPHLFPLAEFLAILPRIQRHGQIAFRHVRCPTRREEALAEMIALAWQWCLSLARRGKDPRRFPLALATYAARAVQAGRRLCGQEKANDALSPRAQQRHDFTIHSLPDGSSLAGNVLDEALHDNTQTPVPDQVSFRLDFPAWLCTYSERNRQVIRDLMSGQRTMEVSRKYGLSPGRISQLRRQFMQDWERFGQPRELARSREQRRAL